MLQTTEKLSTGIAFDAVSSREAASLFLDGQRAAIAAVGAVVPEIDAASSIMAQAVREGGSLVYAAAGSSGLMALADASELPGTFGIAQSAIKIHMAGGVPVDGCMPGDTEDDARAAEDAGDTISRGDAVIVLSASGATPYALAIAERAKANGAKVIALANNPNTPLLELADVAICLETPAEVIAGSTRLAAGSAQKAALNLMSSMMGVKLGHVYQGMMVNLKADNAKLILRAAAIVMRIADVSFEAAETALKQASGSPKLAILIAKGSSRETAIALLEQHNGHLGPCLTALSINQNQNA